MESTSPLRLGVFANFHMQPENIRYQWDIRVEQVDITRPLIKTNVRQQRQIKQINLFAKVKNCSFIRQASKKLFSLRVIVERESSRDSDWLSSLWVFNWKHQMQQQRPKWWLKQLHGKIIAAVTKWCNYKALTWPENAFMCAMSSNKNQDKNNSNSTQCSLKPILLFEEI